MIEAWLLTGFCGLICVAAVIDKSRKLYNKWSRWEVKYPNPIYPLYNRWSSSIVKTTNPFYPYIKMNTIQYLQIFDIVKQQLERKFRDSTLPPNMIDTMAHTRAIKEAMDLHKQKKLVTYYKKLKAGV